MSRVPRGCALAGFWALLAAVPAPAGHGTGGPVLAIPSEYAKRLLDEGDQPVFIDLRPASEFQKERVPGAHSLPISASISQGSESLQDRVERVSA